MQEEYKIDFVIPWVDDSDPAWQRDYARYSKEEFGDARSVRFRDWGTLRYWFRGVERFAPWVNKIHFVTWGHLPEWLNTAHPKLHVVNHRDYIPAEYLPTFSSHPIELNIHRIEGLAEQFVYFNDDTFIIKHISEKDFFVGGLPCDMCVPNAITPRLGEFSPILLQTTSYINKHFNKRQDIRRNPGKWFSPKYGALLIRTFCLMPWTFHTGFFNHHQPQPFRKTTLETLWREEPDILHQTCLHRFRNAQDVNQYIFRYWHLASGNFVPRGNIGKYVSCDDNVFQNTLKCLKQRKKPLICINDGEISDFETSKAQLQAAFEAILPDKSQFEL